MLITSLIIATAIARSQSEPSLPVIPLSIYAKPHRQVPIDGSRRLDLLCLGRGRPTVILESGTGGGTRDWRQVQRAIAKHAKVCAYDRAGFGFSDASTRPSDARSVVDDLHRLTLRAGLEKPFIIVGHSNGGIYATRYAQQYPKAVSGIVLIDPGFTGQQDFARYGLSPEKANALRRANKRLISFASDCLQQARSGALTKPGNAASPCLDNPPKPDRRLHEALMKLESRPAFFRSYLSEFRNTFETREGRSINDAQVPLKPGMLGRMPVIVLTAASHVAPVQGFSPTDQKNTMSIGLRA